jgi:HlyD family secretion protein
MHLRRTRTPMFRQEALDRLSSPEQLDQLMQAIKPKAWISLTTMGFLVATAGVWSVYGRIPLTVTGQGVLIRPSHVVQLQSPSSGALLTLNIKPGDTVRKGDVLGIIEQSTLKQQLQQEQTKLLQLQTQNQDTERLEKQVIDQQIRMLEQQRIDMESSLKREQISPQLRDRDLTAIAQKRQTLQLRQQQIKGLEKIFQQRVEKRRQLFQDHVISQDLLVQAEQEYINTQTQLSEIDLQIKDLQIQATNTQRQSLDNLNKIDEIKTKIKDLDTQQTKLHEQDLKQAINKINQIQEVKLRIAQLRLQLAKDSRIISKYNAQVLQINVVPGQIINSGVRLGSLEVADPKAKLMSVIYFDNKDGKQIKSGMSVQVTPSFAKRERYGGMVGVLTNISPFPVTTQDITAIVGNEDIATSLAKNGEVRVQAFAQLQEAPTSISGYKWSSGDEPPLKISSGTTTSVQVKIGEKAPISYIIPILRSWTGIY